MKSATEWNEDDLLSLASSEPTHIEFKGRRGLDLTLPNVNENHVKTELSVAISAFANSGGGLIIYGVKNPQPGKPLEIDDGGIDMNMKGRSTTQEWLEDVIPHLTDYPLPSFEVHPIKGEKEGSQILENRAVFLIEIPDSERAPHQAKDRKYYIRAGGKSQPAEHIFVMDIAGRRQYPIIEIELFMKSNLDWLEEKQWLNSYSGGILPAEIEHRELKLLLNIRNIGRVYAKYINCILYLPFLASQHRTKESVPVSLNGQDYFVYKFQNTSNDPIIAEFANLLSAPKGEHSIPLYNPLLPSLGLTWELELPKGLNPSHESHEVVCEIYADNAAVKRISKPMNKMKVITRNGIATSYTANT